MSLETDNFVDHHLRKSRVHLVLAKTCLEELSCCSDAPDKVRDKAKRISEALELDVNEVVLLLKYLQDITV